MNYFIYKGTVEIFFFSTSAFQPLLALFHNPHLPITLLLPSSPHPLIPRHVSFCPPLVRTAAGEFSSGHFLFQHTWGYANNWKIQLKLYVFV